MPSESRPTHIWVDADGVALETYRWFTAYDEWPTPMQLHDRLAEKYRYPNEHAEHDVWVALELDAVYGLHSVVAMRLGEAFGDWRDPLPLSDNGFRIAVRPEVIEAFSTRSYRCVA